MEKINKRRIEKVNRNTKIISSSPSGRKYIISEINIYNYEQTTKKSKPKSF